MRLEILAEERFCPVAGAAVEAAAGAVGLLSRQAQALAAAAQDVVREVAQNAYPSGQAGRILLELEEEADRVSLSLHDWGLPSHSVRAIESTWEHIDEIASQHCGPDGRKVRLSCKHTRPVPVPATPRVEVCDIDPAAMMVRLLQPEDAPGVADAIYMTYGNSYPVDVAYFPDRLIEANRNDTIITAVAVAPSGEIMGTESMRRDNPDGKIFESGMAAVIPKFRRQQIPKRLAEVLWKELLKRGCVGMVASTVTSHPFSQKLAAAGGFHEIGLLIGYTPRLDFKGMQTLNKQRESTAQWAQDFIGGWEVEVYPPAPHHDMIELLLKRLKWRFSLGKAQPSQEAGVFHWKAYPAFRSFHVVFDRIGPESWEGLRALIHDCDRQGFEYSHIEMPLSDPGLPGLVACLSQAGYFFAQVGIGTGHGDATLTVQRLFGTTVDLDELALESSNHRELRDYIKSTAPVLALE